MLKIQSLKKEYSGFTLDCSLEVKAGNITALIGQNGAGKSTAFKAALGLITPSGGNVCVLGKNITDFSDADRQNIGVVLSNSGFSGYLTLKDILLILKNMYKSFDADFFVSEARRFSLPLDKKINEFSTGMKAKLKVLVAISHGAHLLILDEPTAGLDVVARDELLFMLREFMELDSERAILISSHISSDLQTLCDDIYMMHNGKIILHEDTDVLLSDYALLKVSDNQYERLDKDYILYTNKENFGYTCLTNQRRFYAENFPNIVIEQGSIDGIITTIIKGDKL